MLATVFKSEEEQRVSAKEALDVRVGHAPEEVEV